MQSRVEVRQLRAHLAGVENVREKGRSGEAGDNYIGVLLARVLTQTLCGA